MVKHLAAEQKLCEALWRIATLRPVLGKKSNIRGALSHAQQIAAAALGDETITIGLDAYDREGGRNGARS